MLLFTNVVIVVFGGALGVVNGSVSTSDFDWDQIAPSQKLQYHDCYEEFRCARLKVPLDWHDPTDNRSAAIAIITLPASVPHNDPTYGGIVITNPGGPGGTGVQDLQVNGHRIRDFVDGAKHYDILSFDPRGIFHSTPRADCYNDDFMRGVAASQQRGIGGLDVSEQSLRRQFARARAFGQLCRNGYDDGNAIFAYVSTASVARDMLEIVDRTHELQFGNFTSTNATLRDQGPSSVTKAQRNHLPKLQYIGFSYGTQLGNTFASMFPGRVGRMVLDGNVDAYDFANGTWLKNLLDTEKVVDYFYRTCFEAGIACPLRNPVDASGQDIRARVEALLVNLTQHPASSVMESQMIIVTPEDVRAVILASLYQPLASFRNLAILLSEAIGGNYTLLARTIALPERDVSCAATKEPLQNSWGLDAAYAVACGDGNDASSLTVSDYADYVAKLKNDSPTVGSNWAATRFECSGWRIRPKWRFTGPFGTSPAQDMTADSPAAPLLFLSSKLDPSTPLANAIAMSELHPGSAVLIQDSAGHCAFYSAPSRCTKMAVEKYMESGEVPRNGTTCEADCDQPWTTCERLVRRSVDLHGFDYN